MENKPKKSKALIITIIAVILLLIAGYLIYKNRDSFGVKTSTSIGKIFSPLLNSLFNKDLTVITPTFEECTNGAINPPSCSEFMQSCENGAINPPSCSEFTQSCANGAINPPSCSEFTPSVAITTNSTEVASGGSSTISWTSTGITTCNMGGDTDVSTTGTFDTGPLLESKAYTIVCNGKDGTLSDNIFVSVIGGSNLFPAVKVTASPSSVAVGASSTVSWISTNTTSCKAGLGNGTGITGSFKTGTLSASKSYTVTCIGALGYSSGNVYISVGGELKQCSDRLDNDGDTLVDILDPNCHIDGDLNKAYVADHYSESSSPVSGDSDLKAGFVTPSNTLINTPTTLSSVIRNDGNGSTATSFSSFFTISKINPNDNKPSTTGNIDLVVPMPTLSAGTSNTAKITYKFSSVGTYYIRACADKKSGGDAGAIIESNEDNNCGPWTTFTVSNSLPSSGLKQCSDRLDNDLDGFIDELDPNCHIDGNLNNEYIADHDSESTSPTVSYQCNDKIDNDLDGKIDAKDPNCHLDGDLNKAYIAEHNSESTSPITPAEENKCLLIEQNPLTFTDTERARLAVLLRKFYIIAPTLKIDADINVAYSELDKYNSYSSRLDELTRQCYLETNDVENYDIYCALNPNSCNTNDVPNKDYTGPTQKFGNPWYKYGVRGSYIPPSTNLRSSQSTLCSTYAPSTLTGIAALVPHDVYPGHPECNTSIYIPTSLNDYEQILNIW